MNSKPARGVRPDAHEPAPDKHDPPARFGEIYRREVPRLVGYFFSKVGNRDDADDMAHETFTRFLSVAGPVNILSPGGYLTRIASNLLRDRAKRGSTKLARISFPIEEGHHAIASDDPHRELEAREEARRWKAILALLPPLTHEIFLLNRVERYTYAEIAIRLDITVWRVQKHMLKALRHIEIHLDSIDD